jgi:hypothetical protein
MPLNTVPFQSDGSSLLKFCYKNVKQRNWTKVQ